MKKSKGKSKGPTPLMRLFVAAMKANELNATEAYIEAGGSKKTAHSAGPRLTKHPWVAAQLEKELAAQVKKLDMKGDDVIRELKSLGFSRVKKLFNAKGQLIDPRLLDDETDAAIASIEVGMTPAEGTLDDGAPKPAVPTLVKVKFWDKPKALELLGKYFKLWAERVVHTTDPDAEKLTLEELRAAAKE